MCSYFLCVVLYCFFFFKQKTAYEMRISDWSSDVCSSDLLAQRMLRRVERQVDAAVAVQLPMGARAVVVLRLLLGPGCQRPHADAGDGARVTDARPVVDAVEDRKSTRLNSSH